MLGHLFIELCFLADIALSQLRLIIFSYLLRKTLRTVSPDLRASLIWRTQGGSLLQTDATPRI